MPEQRITIDSSTAWTLAYNNENAEGAATLLQQESGTLSSGIGIAGAFPEVEDKACSLVASLYWPYNKGYEKVETSLWPEDYVIVDEDNRIDPDLSELHEGSYVETPLNANKLVNWLQQNTPESPYSTHLYLEEMDKQAWTYVTDFTLHPKTPNVEINGLPFHYYLHARIRADNKLEFAFFDSIVENLPSAVDFDLANIKIDGSDPVSTRVQTLQYTCGDQSIAALRVAGKEEAETFLTDGNGKLLKARCPKFLGTLMHSGAQIVEIGYNETPNREVRNEVVSYYGHIWSYWGTIENNILYIVGIPLYQGDETGFVPQIENYGSGIFNYKHTTDFPPTYPMASPYIYDGIYGNTIYTFDEWFSAWNNDSTMADKNSEFREAFEKIYSKNTFIKGWWGADYAHSGVVFYDSSRCTVKEILEDSSSNSSVSVMYTLASPSIRSEETVLQDSVTEGFNGRCMLISDRGGFYNVNNSLQPIEYIDSEVDSNTSYYGYKPGVVYKDNAPFQQVGESVDDVSNGIINKVCSGFVSIPTQFPTAVYPDNSTHPKGWTVHAFNVMQKGNVYTIWTSSFTSAYTIQGNVTLDPVKRYSTDYETYDPGPIPPDPGPGPGPIEPEPEPEPDPEPGPGPSPGPHPTPPNPGPTQWTQVRETRYYYSAGTGVQVQKTSGGDPSSYVENYIVEIDDWSGSGTIAITITLRASVVSPVGQYPYNPNGYLYDMCYGLSKNSSGLNVVVSADSNQGGAGETSHEGNASYSLNAYVTAAFNVGYLSSTTSPPSDSFLNFVKSGNDIVLTRRDYSTHTETVYTIKHYKINRNTGKVAEYARAKASQNLNSINMSYTPSSVTGELDMPYAGPPTVTIEYLVASGDAAQVPAVNSICSFSSGTADTDAISNESLGSVSGGWTFEYGTSADNIQTGTMTVPNTPIRGSMPSQSYVF